MLRRIGAGGPFLVPEATGDAFVDVQQRVPLVTPTPQRRQIGAIDFIPNLLITTLAVVATTLPVGKQLFDSAPRAKPAVYAQQQHNTLALGINPQPKTQQLSDSAPSTRRIGFDAYPNLLTTTLGTAMVDLPSVTIDLGGIQGKYQLGSDVYPNLLQTTLGTPPVQPQGKQLSASAPYPKFEVRSDVYPNTVLRGIPSPSAVPFIPYDTSREQRKLQVQADAYSNILILGINPQPVVLQLDRSAPWIKYQPKVDYYPNLSITTLAPTTTPVGAQWNSSAPPPKYAIQGDAYPNMLVRGINPQPRVNQLSASAPPPKYAVQVDRYPNLQESTLFVAPVMPPGKQISASSPTNTSKFNVQVDVPTNYTGVIPASVPLVPKLYLRYRFPDYPVPRSERRRR